MTAVLVFFALALLMALGLAWGLLGGSHAFQDPAYPDVEPDPSRYQVLTKLVGREDTGLLADRKPGHRLRRARRKLARRYLREMRVDFLRVCSMCRLIAPCVEDPEFMANVVRELLQFHVLYMRVQVRIVVGAPVLGAAELERLVKALGQLQQTAYAALPVS